MHPCPVYRASDQRPDLDAVQRSSQKQVSRWGTCLDGTTPVFCQGGRAVYANPRDSCRPGSGDNGPTCTRGPSGCIPGSLVPTHLYTAARDHLDGGHSGRHSSTPRSQQLGYHGINDLVIHSSDSGSRFPTRMYNGTEADRIHTHTPKGEHNGFDFVVSRGTSPGRRHSYPPHLLGE